MTHRRVRVLLLLLALLAQGAGAYWVIQLETEMTAARAAGRAVDRQTSALLAALADFRNAQQAYVAVGQDDHVWAERASTSLRTVYETLAELRPTASASATAALDRAADVVREFTGIDARAREYARTGQTLTASDLIFGEALEATTAAVARLREAREQDQQDRDTLLARLRRSQASVIAAAAAVTLIALVILVPRRKAPHEAAQPKVTEEQAPRFETLNDGTEFARVVTPPSPVGRPAPHPNTAPSPANLRQMAQACVELARTTDPREVDLLLARVAHVLDAAGIVVWMEDASGAGLRPVLAHGYAEQALARMGHLPRDADNATADAFRAGQIRSVRGDQTMNGAVAIPLLAPHGCIGVMAVELRNRGEANDTVRAMATIVAAQLATLVGAPPQERRTQNGERRTENGECRTENAETERSTEHGAR